MGWRAPELWTRRGAASAALLPAAAVYGALAGARMRRTPRHACGVPVIAIGNFVTGGAGKTPTAIHVAERARAAEGSPFVVMRGYGGRLAGPVRVDPAVHGPADVGDEALLIAGRGLPVVVARDRAAGAAFAEASGADLIVLDDGFQSPAVAKDASLVVVDAGYGLGNGRVFPAGPLRAPLDVQLRAASAVLLVGAGEPAGDAWRRVAASGLPMLRGRLEPVAAEDIAGVRVVGFAGIGRPGKFEATLRALGAEIAGFVPFPDHRVFTPEDAARLIAAADSAGARLMTTEKDRVRLGRPEGGALAALAERVGVVQVELAVDADLHALMIMRAR